MWWLMNKTIDPYVQEDPWTSCEMVPNLWNQKRCDSCMCPSTLVLSGYGTAS